MRKTKIKAVSVKQARRSRKLAAIPVPEDGLCAKCGQRKPLIKHHKKLRSDRTDDRRSNLIWICQSCHDAFHDRERKQIKAKPAKASPLMLAGYGKPIGGFRPFSKAEQAGIRPGKKATP